MSLNLNSGPYYDDFDPTKNYHRVLFKPGVAVQARELTQLQTILSDQLGQLGSFNLKEGAVISGCEQKIENFKFVKIIDDDANGDPISNADLASYDGEILVGATTGLRARIITHKTGQITVSDTINTKALYIVYIDENGQNADLTTNQYQRFQQGETLTVEGIKGKTFVTQTTESGTFGKRDFYAGVAPHLTMSPGIIYALGNFIRTKNLSVFIDSFSPYTDKKIGFLVNEAIKQASVDNTLYDNASGSFNEGAPGADRLEHTVSLISYNRDSSPADNFFQIATYSNGKITRANIKTDPLGGIREILARETFDRHGNYVSKGMQVYFTEHLRSAKGKNNGRFAPPANNGIGDATKLILGVTAGSGNVAGYPVEYLEETEFSFSKPSATQIEKTVSQSTSFGNYVIVNDLCGVWDTDGADGSANGIVNLHSVVSNGVSGGAYSNTSLPGNIVGTAKIRHIELSSGTPGTSAAEFKLYLFDIKMFDGEFGAVRSISYENSEANAFADIVLNSAGVAQVYEKTSNKFLWNLPYKHLKTLKAATGGIYGYNFKFIKEYDRVADSNGVINLAPDAANHTFFFGNGSVSESNVASHIKLVARESFDIDGTVIEKGEFIDLTGKVTQNSETSLTIDLGTQLNTIGGAPFEVRVYVNMQVSDTAPITKSLVKTKYVKIQADTNENFANNRFCLGVPDVFRVTRITATTNADYTTGARNVSSLFNVDTGQRDNFYGLSYIEKKSSSTIDLTVEKYITVEFDYFDNGTITGPTFACIDSYPVDDTGITGIRTEEIPLYVSKSSGKVFDLRNAIDFRPFMESTETPGGTEATAPVNPSSFEQIKRPGGGLTNPIPSDTFTTDLEFYLAEAYRVIVTTSGKIDIVKGVASVSPRLPPPPPGAMTLATGVLPPYPCLSQRAATNYGREDLAMTIVPVKNKKYTMRDIGALEQRISNLEYYTTLTLLEKEAGKVVIPDSDGIDRYKNGYLVDSFSNFSVVQVNNPDTTSSIDVKKRELRAAFKTSQIGFKPIASGSTAGQSGYFWHVPYNEAIYTQQTQASSYRNVVGELFITPPAATEQEAEETGGTGQDQTETDSSTNDTESSDRGTTPTSPSYHLIRSKTTVNEGDSFTITLETTNVPEGTVLGYTVLHSSGLTSNDYSTVPTTAADGTGTLTVDSTGFAYLRVTVAEDLSTDEGSETWRFTLSDIGINASTSVTINDTSTASSSSSSGSSSSGSSSKTTNLATGPWIGSCNIQPPVSNFIDTNYEGEPLQNDNGEYDHLLRSTGFGLLEGYSSGWDLQWSNWEFATSTIGSQDPGINFGTSANPANATETPDGLYIPEYDATWVNPETIDPNSTTEWQWREYDYLWNGSEQAPVIEETANIPVKTLARAENLQVNFWGLKPNTRHVVLVNGKRYASNGNTSRLSFESGRFSVGIILNPGEWPANELIKIEATNHNDLSQADSYAVEYFYPNHRVRRDVITNLSTRFPKPAYDPVRQVKSERPRIEESFGREAADSPGLRHVKLTNGNEDPWVSVNTTDNQGQVRANRVPIDQLDLNDTVLGVECQTVSMAGLAGVPDSGISRSVLQRPDGTRYGVEIIDPGCAVYNDFVQSRATPSVAAQGEVFTEIDSVATGTVQVETQRIVVTDDSETVDTQTGTVQTIEASRFTHGDADDSTVTINTSTTATNLGESNIKLDSSPTNKDLEKAPETINVPNALSVSGTDDIDLSKILDAIDFDFSIPELCIGEVQDPLAQSFFVEGMEGGMFITSADVFFRNKSSEENNNGITLQIREVINGVPGPYIIAESHKTRSECLVSTEDSSGNVTFNSTNFKFSGPVHLQNNTEYCMVLKPDGNDRGYEVWLGKLGEIRKGSTEVITEQTHSGVLFTSANNRTWSAHQDEDLMFVIRRAKFEVNQDYIINTVNKNIDWIKFDADEWDRTPSEALGLDNDDNPLTPASYFPAGDFVHGFKATINSAGSYATDGTYNLVFTNTGTNGSNAAGTYTVSGGIVTEITLTNPGTGYTSAPTVALTSGDPTTAATVSLTLNRAQVSRYDRGLSTYELEVNSGSFVVGDLVGNGLTYTKISSIEDRDLSAYVVQYHSINPDQIGKITPKIALTPYGSSLANTTLSDAVLQATVELPEVKTVYSYSNEIARDGEKTARIQFTLRTPSNNLSPIIDLAAMDMLAVVNKINYPKDDGGNSTVAEEVRTGGNAQSKYITRKVVLAEGQDAEDLKIFLDNAIPSDAAVEVYAKLQNAEDDGEFTSDIYWRKLEVETSPFIATTGFAEYSYKIPEKSTGAWGVDSATGIFEYDVTRVASIPVVSGGTYASAPIIKITDDAGVGYGASAEAIMSGNTISEIRITNPGRDYSAGNVNAQIVSGSGGETVAGSLGTATTSTVTYKSFKQFAIKIVHLSSNRAILPKTKTLRAYALQV